MTAPRARTLLVVVLVALVVLLVLAGVPLVNPRTMCPDCGPVFIHASASCPYVVSLTGVLAALVGMALVLAGERRRWRDRLGSAPPHRPPRLI